MSSEHLPSTDSIEELAAFWDVHDLTDFEDQFEEVTKSVFERDRAVLPKTPKSISGQDSEPIADR